MALHGVSRASVAVMHDGRLVFAAGYGGRGANERVPVWSLSKAITALCIATLIRDGKLSLLDPIGRLLVPIFRKFGDPADQRLKRVTVAQLLTHRSGIPRSADDNQFAPGLVQILRERAPCQASVEMLMPQIIKVPLVREPGSELEYTNTGYLLLGQIIEVLTGKSYVAAGEERVLARAGIKAASLDRDWGPLMQAAAGWALSGPEYLAFARLLRGEQHGVLTPETSQFLTTPDDKWTDADRRVGYTLGVFVHPGQHLLPDFWHAGGHNWTQPDAAGGPIDEVRRTSFVLVGDGTGWFASYDGLSAGTAPVATVELDRSFWSIRDSVSCWPELDQFPSTGRLAGADGVV